MSYFDGTPNGKLYVGNVKWSNDYKNVMLFDTRINRNEFMESHLTLIKENVIFINPNRYVDIDAKIDGVENYNYIYYDNDSDISNTHYCCFVTDYEYIAPKTTRLYLELDVFQMYHYSADYYQSFIERAIIKQSADGSNYLPEPVSAPLIYEHVVSDILTQADWQPIWVLHTASYYNSSTGEYDYSGKGTNSTYGEYGRFINSKTEMADILKMYGRQSLADTLEKIQTNIQQSSSSGINKNFWTSLITTWLSGGISTASGYNDLQGISALTDGLSIAQFQDHRDELIGLYAIPYWLYKQYTTPTSQGGAGGDPNYADNDRVSVSATININTSSLANGYTPRNKKMLTSVCRAYVLANKTGLQIPFKPELFGNHTSATLHLYGITMATSGYQYYVDNYDDYQTAYGEVAYNSERRVGYDANTGINKALSIISAGAGSAAGVGQIATGTPVGMVAGAGTIGQNLVSAIDSLGTKEQHFGNNGDLLRITGARPQLHWYELNPSVSECQAIDNFFDMYGYTIQKHQNPLDYLYNKVNGAYDKTTRVRPKWEYIKTDNINLRGGCPADYENKLKAIWNNGVTFWNDYSHFGDYSQQNYTTP